MLTIYGVYRSRTAWTIWMMLELGVQFRHVPIVPAYRVKDLQAPDAPPHSMSAEFREINPSGKVPVVVDGDLVMHQSLAINLYLAKKHGGPLAAASLQEEALLAQWSLWVVNEVEPRLIVILEHRMMLPEGERDPALADAAWAKLQKPFGVLEQMLTDRDYLVGNRFTVADLNVSIVMSLINRLQLDITRYPNVRAWLDTCLGRPAAKGYA